jgi:hypothetical protein
MLFSGKGEQAHARNNVDLVFCRYSVLHLWNYYHRRRNMGAESSSGPSSGFVFAARANLVGWIDAGGGIRIYSSLLAKAAAVNAGFYGMRFLDRYQDSPKGELQHPSVVTAKTATRRLRSI